MKPIGRKVTTKDYPRVNVRIPQKLFDHLAEVSTKNMRSVNSEITLRLLRSMNKDKSDDK